MPLQPPSRPVTLPTELWERVFLHLAPEQVVRLRSVNRNFRGLIDVSPEVQYLIDLYAAGLEVGLQDPSLTLADRRKQLDRYRLHWDSLQWIEHTSIPLQFYRYHTVVGGVVCLVLFAEAEDTTADFRFIQLPSVLRSIPLKQWILHGLPHNASKPGLLPEEDLLAVSSPVNDGRSFTVQLLRMSDGQPHPSASIPILNGRDYGRDWMADVVQIQLTRSRLAVTVLTFVDEPPRVSHFVVWDWKTGVKFVVSSSQLWHSDVHKPSTLQDVLRHSQSAQFVDEYRIFGVSKAMDPGSQRSVTLLDTSVSVEDPQKPMEIELGLDFTEPPMIHLTEGTYAQGAREGPPFWTDRKRHILCITPFNASRHTQHFEFVIDYGSICAIASENGTASYIPWDHWKRKTTLLHEHPESTLALGFVGPRVLTISRKPYQGPLIRSLDFTPGACRFTKQIDTCFEDAPWYAFRRAILTDTFPEGHEVGWVFSEDNVLAFTQQSSDKPQVLEIWTF